MIQHALQHGRLSPSLFPFQLIRMLFFFSHIPIARCLKLVLNFFWYVEIYLTSKELTNGLTFTSPIMSIKYL